MRMPRPTLRPFTPEDRPVLQAIRAAAFRPVFRSFAEIVGEEIAAAAFARLGAEQAQLLDSLCGEDTAATMLVAVLDGTVVGFIAYTIDRETRSARSGSIEFDHAGLDQRGAPGWCIDLEPARPQR